MKDGKLAIDTLPFTLESQLDLGAASVQNKAIYFFGQGDGQLAGASWGELDGTAAIPLPVSFDII